ncbi:ABC transporter ATP-binding protein [Halobellus sp. Atlit-38R]|uniref:ABC transporter ATP-binding protein n=1 Tax=Halobellus sp. Atlit-38R TaxID=2282131 RepID=UPI000EF17B21|nr:ABC transporter ATP-binding protein [Halobellus sp. Atlit-38R]RLM83907.1 ABC transporter ATP-binding protein [Halobellus sp. Atlit-38R]
MSSLKTEGLTKRFGDIVAVDDVSLSVNDGELWCLLGPSGCGKSTTLRMLGGLEHPTDGSIYLGDQEVTNTRAYERNTSMVFQSWALFPHKSVLENVAFGPKMQGVEKSERIERAEKYLDMVQMSNFKSKAPTDLSGGQQQRVALARSLSMNPSTLLLDEPLSNLDKRLKEEMQIELKRIHEELETTMIYVTHDQDEAFTLADRISIMNNGELVQVGTPRDVYANPDNQFVEEFLGDTNMISTTVQQVTSDSAVATTASGKHLTIPVQSPENLTEGTNVPVSLRPEFLDIERHSDASTDAIRSDGTGDASSFRGEVTTTLYRGSTVRNYIDIGNEEIFVERHINRGVELEGGDIVTISWDPTDLLCFDERNERVA